MKSDLGVNIKVRNRNSDIRRKEWTQEEFVNKFGPEYSEVIWKHG